MKTLTTIILITILSVNLSAQSPVKYQTFSTSTKVLTVTLASVLFNAAGDGLNDNGQKGWGHALNALSIATLLLLPAIVDNSEWLPTALTYVGFRFSTFNPMYNSVRGLPLTYMGTTSWDDRLFGKLKPPDGMLFFRSIAFITTVSIPINHLNYHKEKHYRHNKKFKIE